MSINKLLSSVTVTGAGDEFRMSLNGAIPAEQTYQAYITGSGGVSGAVVIEGSNYPAYGYTTMATLSPTGTNEATTGAAYVGPWQYVRARVTSITGTGAEISVVQGIR
jgi:hypothetical protein